MERRKESMQGRRLGDRVSVDRMKGGSGSVSRSYHLPRPVGKSLPSIASSKLPSSTKVKFYRNGDINFGGVEVCISNQRYRSLEALVQDLNEKMNLPRGVRAIYTPGGVTRISSIHEFEQGSCYVCSSKQRIKKMDYSAAKSPLWLPFTKRKQVEAAGSFVAPGSLRTRSTVCDGGLCELCDRNCGHEQRDVVLSVHSQWVTEARKYLINRHILRSWDDTLSDIARVAGVPRTESPHLYTAETGKSIDSLSKLLHCGTQDIVVKISGDAGNDQKSQPASPMTAPAVRPALTGKSTPESVTACPTNKEEANMHLEDAKETTLQDKDEVPEEREMCPAKEGDHSTTLVGEPNTCIQDNQLAESEMYSESCKPSEHTTHDVPPEGPEHKSDHNEHTTEQETQAMPAKGEDAIDKEMGHHQVVHLPNTSPDRGVSFRLSDLPAPRERSESIRTDLSSFSSAANFRPGAPHMAIRGLHAISPNSGSNISLSVPYLMKMKMNPPADYEDSLLLEGHGSLFTSNSSTSVKETREVGIQATPKGHEIDSVVEVNDVRSRHHSECQHTTDSVTDLYEPGRTLGEGNYAKVQECTQKTTNKNFLLKTISKAKIFGFEDVILRELRMMRSLNHPNIVKLEADYEDEDSHYLVMEHVNGGDLFYAIMECQHFKESDTAVAMRNLGHALMYLHNHKIAHRGISPENLFFCVNPDGSKTFKLGNFGAAAYVSEPLSVICGSITYVAPEMLFGTGYGVKVDMWATGVVCYIMLSGVSPFIAQPSDRVLYGRKKRSKEIVIEKITTCRFSFSGRPWDSVSDTAKDFIRCLLVASPGKRYSAEDALRHLWLRATSATSTDMTMSPSAPSGSRFGTKLGFVLTALDIHMKDPNRQFRIDAI